MNGTDYLEPDSLIVDGTPGPEHAHADGTPWKYALLRGEQTILADEPGTLLGYLIDGYDDIPDDEEGDEEALVMRVEQAVLICSTIQAMLCADATSEGKFNPAEESEETLTALLGDRTIPVLHVAEWTHEVPLVVLTTDYAPYTTHTPPGGNVWWLDPSDEAIFLQSLSTHGLIQLYVHGDS